MMLTIKQEDLNHVAEQLAVLHMKLRDENGLLTLQPFAGEQYPRLILGALATLTGEPIAFDGEIHLKITA